MYSQQVQVRAWVEEVFTELEQTDVPERALRLLEEAVELVQSVGVTEQTAHKLVSYVFSRPSGEPDDELAGVFITAFAAAISLDISAGALVDIELKRINRPEVIKRVRARQKEKREALR